MNDADCDFHQAPGYLVNAAYRHFTRMVDRDLRPLGVSVAQLYPLFILAQEGPMLQRDLVKRSTVGQPAMVETLARLERAGLIERRRNEEDRRASTIDLTAQGREAVETASASLLLGNEKALSGFSSEERATLLSLLGRLIRNIADDLEPEA